MNEQKHTPGDWRFTPTRRLRENRAGYIGSDEKRVAYVYGEKTKFFIGEAEANARLIAAAPSLLSALQQAAEDLRDMHDGADPDTGESAALEPIIDRIDAAIAKATQAEGGEG